MSNSFLSGLLLFSSTILFFSSLLLLIFSSWPSPFSAVSATSISGKWSIPELTPPPRSLAAMQCFVTYDEDPFTYETTYSTSLQLFGGRIEGDEAVQTTFSWFDEENQWFPQTNALPVARAGFAVVFDDVADPWERNANTAYMFGGTQSGDTLTDNYVYKSQRGSPWRKTLVRAKSKNDAPPLTRFGYWVGYMPYATGQDFEAGTNGALFIWGGLSSGGVNPSLYWFSLDDVSEKGLRWGQAYKVAADGPNARYDMCCNVVPDPSDQPTTAFCFGGAGLEQDYNDLWEVDWSSCDQDEVDSSPWSACASWSLLHAGNITAGELAGDDYPPTPRRSPACAYVYGEDAFYVYGGYDANSGKAINDTNLYRFDWATEKWAKTPQKLNYSDPAAVASVYDESQLLSLRYAASMASCSSGDNETLYLFGGITQDGSVNGQTFKLDLGENSLIFPEHDSPLLFKEVGYSADSRPLGRAEHVSVLCQGELVVMFGRSKLALTSALGDVWKYNVTTREWVQLELEIDEENLLKAEIPRTGAAAIEFRSGILIFGGQNSLGVSTDDLLILQPLNGEIRRIEPSGDIPAPRSYHVMVRLADFVIVGTGWSSDTSYMSDWWRYNSVEQSWTELTVVGDHIGARLAMASIELYNESHSIVGGGIGSRVFADWFWLTLEDSNTKLRVTKMNLDYSTITTGERGIIRAYTALAGSGNHLVLCGGAISEIDPAPAYTSCYQLDLTNDNISVLPTPYLTGVYGTATMVENKIVLFGGQQTTATSFTDKFIDSAQIFTVAQTCPAGAPSDDQCIKCSKGFKNVGSTPLTASCVVAPQGTYIVDGLDDFILCPAGTFSRAIGAFSSDACLPCPIGTYNPNPGANNCTPCSSGNVCLAGAKQEVAANSLQGQFLSATLSQSGRIFETNPKPYVAPSIPWFPILFVALTALILTAVVASVLIVSHWVWIKRRDYYASEEVESQLRTIYLQHAKAVRGMSEKEFITATFSENFPEHEGSLLEMQQLFKELNVNGIGALSYYEFVEAFVLMISRGHMKPLKGSEREKEGKEFDHWAAPLIGKWDVRNFDNFADDHMTATVGEKILTQQIPYGGAVSLFFYVAVVILILAIVINFLYNNTTETKASVPRAVIQSSFGSLFQVESDFVVSVTILGPVRSMAGISTLEDACVADSTINSCRSTASVSTTNVQFGRSDSVQPLTCVYDDKVGCTITWACEDCYITEGSTGTLLVRLAPQVAASTIDVDVSVSTGIRDPVMAFTGKLSMVGGPNQQSQVISRAVPSISTEVLTGFPASNLYFGLTPSYYEADEVENAIAADSNTYRATGYHIRQNNQPIGGNTVPTELFSQYYDAPVQVNLKVDEVPLLVRRKFTQTIVQLITSLLGAIAGLSGGLLAAVQFLDTKLGINENSDELKHDELENDDEVAGLNDMYSHIDKLMTPEEFVVVRPIIEKGVGPEQALAFLEILRRRKGSGGKGNDIRIAGRQKSAAEFKNNNNNNVPNQVQTIQVVTGTVQNMNQYSPRAAENSGSGEDDDDQQQQEMTEMNNNNNNQNVPQATPGEGNQQYKDDAV